ncbi:EAL domain-containing protein [Microbacterium gallinarum]|uniref:EAL domain-containing protein n=1 Tax=Microbacterium gallinarum TaxID=2762209 RepID=A0ABR8X2W9_9MICO|nr:EAL domain-containing protein [Microbacterium gallinarum]MBD8023669.1 EAL domain-containing protein [Microbacterium gallinarum]
MLTSEDLAADLAAAVGGPEIYAVYQPQVSLETGSIVAAEALCRWEHPSYGDIDPETMIAVAERSGVIHALGRRMLAEGLRAQAEWHESSRPWAVAVNVSPLQFADDSFATHVAEEYRRRRAASGALIVELTSDEAVDDPVVLAQLRSLGEIGVEVSLSGYGEGSLPFQSVPRPPLTEVKIPGRLVRSADGPALASLREAVTIAHDAGLRVVAEGVETLTHLDVAVELGCDRVQGFLIRHPDSEIAFPGSGAPN